MSFTKLSPWKLSGWLSLLISSLLLLFSAPIQAAGAVAYRAEVFKISPKRTLVIVDLERGIKVMTGAKVSLSSADGTIDASVRKVSKDGRAILKLKRPLPAALAVGDDVRISGIDTGNETDAISVVGGRTNWKESTMLGLRQNSGMAAEASLEGDFLGGTAKSTGGRSQENAEFAVTERNYGIDLEASYLTSIIGGGFKFLYLSHSTTAKSEIKTAATATTDSDATSDTLSGYDAVPYIAYASGSGLFKAGIGYQISNKQSERIVTIAGVDGEHSPIKISENGPTLEFVLGLSAVKLGLNILPRASGKLVEEGQQDVDRTASKLGAFVVTNVGSIPTRVGFQTEKKVDSYTNNDAVTSVTGFDFQSDIARTSLTFVPRLGYDMETATLGERSGKGSRLSIGSKVVFNSKWSPFVGVDFKYNMRKEDGSATRPANDSKMMGVGMSTGLAL